MNQQGSLTREEPHSFFGPLVNANQGAPTYGFLAGTKAMDGFYVSVTATNATLTDQNGVATVFASLPVGYYPFSPSAFTVVGGGTFIPVYK
jgi:hypothetical protein